MPVWQCLVSPRKRDTSTTILGGEIAPTHWRIDFKGLINGCGDDSQRKGETVMEQEICGFLRVREGKEVLSSGCSGLNFRGA
jgi:hypothetical protein